MMMPEERAQSNSEQKESDKKKTALTDPGRRAKAVFTAPRVFSGAQRTL
ncbi:hypothetical protein [Rhizobium leguminosarum]|nr:hypothetical protein [Rhizobium leguminosarum]